jgi:valyl-tRNA synthetase
LSYPLADDSGAIQVATTRPETMLADMAVAVHPHDERYRALIGKQIKHPITGRLIPIIADEHADPELGSGAVKITPGHDFNDYEVGKRAGIKPAEMLNMFDAQAKVVQTQDGLIPQSLLGLSREDARKAIVPMLEDEGALVHVEDRVIPTPFGDRSGVVIEPWLTDQWYVDAAKLALPALQAVKKGDIRVVPETWKKTWYNWLENIQPWCVSRQLWWGHRIPAWYGGYREAGAPFTYVAETEDEVRTLAASDANGREILFFDSLEAIDVAPESTWDGSKFVLYRDPDVLDTWFSSALWPFATLGWPEETEEFAGSTLSPAGRGQGEGEPAPSDILDGRTPSSQPSPLGGEGTFRPKPGSDLARHFPNDVLISGFDILFFWDARMAMQGIELMGEAPWKTLYLHGLVRDAQGAKMSKSKGNTVDPLGLIDKYGADALRFTLAAMESQGRDIKLDEKRVEGYRNFATKLWNAARFLQMNGVGASDSIAAPKAELPVNRWIIGEVVETLAKLDAAFDELRYDEMADAIYHFVWGTFCDWYVELVKGAFDEETKRVAAWAFDQILVMLHPLMPFITEELWSANERPYELIVAKWPEPEAQVDAKAKAELEWLIEIVQNVRSARTDLSVPPGAQIETVVWIDGRENVRVFEGIADRVKKLARLSSVDVVGDKLDEDEAYPEMGEPGLQTTAVREMGANVQVQARDAQLFLNLKDVIDVDAERARLSKAADASEKERDSLAQRLANPNFTERAKPEAVEKARADHEAKAAEAERLRAALERLG